MGSNMDGTDQVCPTVRTMRTTLLPYVKEWLGSHQTTDSADLAIAATAIRHGSRLLTRNVRYFPMFIDLHSPY
jgi:hypothetical protein